MRIHPGGVGNRPYSHQDDRRDQFSENAAHSYDAVFGSDPRDVICNTVSFTSRIACFFDDGGGQVHMRLRVAVFRRGYRT